MNYLVTRHKGALNWLRSYIAGPIVHLEHADDFSFLHPGDRVIGTLPVNLAATVCGRGARYFHLSIRVPYDLRGKELTARQLCELGATLEEYRVSKREDSPDSY